jgi:hypothetical protein
MIARGKLVNENEQAVAERRATGLVFAEPGEIKIRGVWAARTVSKVFASSELVNESRKHGRKDRDACPAESHRDGSWKSEPRAQLIATANRVTEELSDTRTQGKSHRECVYCTIKLVNTSDEPITIQKVKTVAEVRAIGREDIM